MAKKSRKAAKIDSEPCPIVFSTAGSNSDPMEIWLISFICGWIGLAALFWLAWVVSSSGFLTHLTHLGK